MGGFADEQLVPTTCNGGFVSHTFVSAYELGQRRFGRSVIMDTLLDGAVVGMAMSEVANFDLLGGTGYTIR